MNNKTQNILFIGMNPSTASPDDSPFHKETSSYRKLSKYIDSTILDQVKLINLYDKKINNNKCLSVNMAAKCVQNKQQLITRYNRIVALGSVVSRALTAHNISHFHMWHPSGLCRLWNNKAATEQKIKELLRFING